MRSADRLLPEVYQELRRLARSRLARLAPGQTLQPTALVHEAYLRLSGKAGAQWNSTRDFYLAAAQAMHDILVEHVRAKASLKRGGGRVRVGLDELTIVGDSGASDGMIALSEALEDLRQRDPRKHQIVLLRYFAGCTAEQTADAMQISLRTVHREWRFTRAWLHKRLSDATR